ncbi:ash family protein [Candidatus Hamiltonella defensa]|nr:ash family protein [Candidatus Hamiltonella defensa]
MAQTIRSIAPKIACHTHTLRTWLRQHGRQRMNNLAREVSSSMETTFVLDVIKNPLPVWANFAYSHHALVNPSDGFRSLSIHKATVDAVDSVFFYVVDNAHQYSMVALSGQSSDWLVSLCTSTANLDIVTAHYEFRSSSGDFLNKHKEIASMATIPSHTHPEFIDTYWIIPEYATEPYGKVSFTRQDCRTFHSIFKYSRLIWCGRKPMHVVMEEN